MKNRVVDFGSFRIRALHTPLVDKLLPADDMDAGVMGAKAIEDSWLKGGTEAGLLPAGDISDLVGGILSVREIIEEMVG